MALVSVVAVAWFLERKDRLAKDTDVADLKLAIEKIVSVQNKITSDMLSITETAEETKKLLSQANLAAGFRMRGGK